MAKKTIATALKAAYAPNRKGIIQLAKDLVSCKLAQSVSITDSSGNENLDTGWVWVSVDKDTYTERIKAQIPAFSVFFRFSGRRSQYYAGPIMEPSFYLQKAEMIGADVADNGDISSSVWTEGARKEKPKREAKKTKTLSSLSDDELTKELARRKATTKDKAVSK